MKKSAFVCILLLISLLTGLLSGCVFSDADMDAAVEFLINMDAATRKATIDFYMPGLYTDAGLTALPSRLTGIARNISIIDAASRKEYLMAFNNRKTFRLSANGSGSMEHVLRYLYDKHDGLKDLLAEEGVTGNVLANAMRMYLSGNDNKPLFTDDTEGGSGFGLSTVSAKMEKQFANIAAEMKIDVSGVPQQIADELNASYDDATKAHLKVVMKEVGIYKPFGSTVKEPPGGGSGTSQGTPKPSASPGVSPLPTPEYHGRYDDITSQVSDLSAEVAGVLDVYETYGDERVDSAAFAGKEAYRFEVAVVDDQIAVYKKTDGGELPVKYSFCEGNTVYFLADSPGRYYLKWVPNHFSDTPGWGKKYIESLYYSGIIGGKSEDAFMPEDSITREEFAKLAVELYSGVDIQANCDFKDVDQSAWYYGYIATARENGLTEGLGDGNFGVGRQITRQDMCTMLYRLAGRMELVFTPAEGTSQIGDGGKIAGYAREGVLAMYGAGILSGDDQGNFNPGAYATRQETAKIIYGILKSYIMSQ